MKQLLLAMVMGVWTQVGVAQAPANAPPTMEELQQQFDAKQYQPLLPKLMKALALRGPAATYDRYKLLMMKGETLVNLKQLPAASESFNAAVKEAPGKDEAWAAKANAVLMRKSNVTGYLPRRPREKGQPPYQPLPVCDPEQRKAAFAALLEDELALNKKKFEAAQEAMALKPVMDAMTVAGELCCIEKAASGADTQTKAMVTGLAGRAAQMLTGALTQGEAKVKSIVASAKKVENFGKGAKGGQGKRGLTSADRQQLNEIALTAQQVGLAAVELEKMPLEDVKAFTDAKTGAERLLRDAQAALNAKYAD